VHVDLLARQNINLNIQQNKKQVSFNKVVICGYDEIRESVKEGITRIVTMLNIMSSRHA